MCVCRARVRECVFFIGRGVRGPMCVCTRACARSCVRGFYHPLYLFFICFVCLYTLDFYVDITFCALHVFLKVVKRILSAGLVWSALYSVCWSGLVSAVFCLLVWSGQLCILFAGCRLPNGR